LRSRSLQCSRVACASSMMVSATILAQQQGTIAACIYPAAPSATQLPTVVAPQVPGSTQLHTIRLQNPGVV
jgi:hypothetical protein